MAAGELLFTKMHGIGNDFVVLDGINQVVNLSSAQVPVSYTHLDVYKRQVVCCGARANSIPKSKRVSGN